MPTSVLDIIDEQYKEFSKTNKIISNYIKSNFMNASFLTIRELSESMGVSTASISRFVNKLGFNGYQDFQKEIQNMVKIEVQPHREIKNSILVRNKEHILHDLIDQNIKNLQDINSDELYEEFDKAVEMIRWDRKVYILGLRSSYTLAHHLYYMLSKYKPNIELIELGAGNTFDNLAFIEDDDMLISICFSKYSRNTIEITEYFNRMGNSIIAITDSYYSPTSKLGDVSLIVQNRHTTFSFVSGMTIINALAVAVGQKYNDKSMERIKYNEAVLKENSVYVLKD